MTFTLPHWIFVTAWIVELICVTCTAISAIAGWFAEKKSDGVKLLWGLWSWLVIFSTICVLALACRAL